MNFNTFVNVTRAANLDQEKHRQLVGELDLNADQETCMHNSVRETPPCSKKVTRTATRIEPVLPTVHGGVTTSTSFLFCEPNFLCFSFLAGFARCRATRHDKTTN